MKRHQSLYPLSHDHHQALVQALNLYKAADAAEIRETLEQHSAIARLIGELDEKLARQEEMVEARLLTNLVESLRRHIRYEEGVLFPAVEASVPEEELWRMNMRLSDR